MLQIIYQSSLTKGLIYLMVFSLLWMTTSCSMLQEEVIPETFTGEEYFEGIFFAFGPFAEKLQYHDENLRKQAEFPQEFLLQERDKVGKLLTKINEVSPDYFNDLKFAIETQNYAKTEQALADGGMLLYENIQLVYPDMGFERLTEQIKADINSGELTTDGEFDRSKLTAKTDEYERLLTKNFINSGGDHDEAVGSRTVVFAVACVFYFAVVAHNALGVTVAAAVAVVAVGALALAVEVEIAGPGNGGPQQGEVGNLEAEILIHDIIEH